MHAKKCLSFVVIAVGISEAAPEKANRAADFVNSIGVCTHWGYPDTPYGQKYAAVRDSLRSLGIRHVRDNNKASELSEFGIRSTFYADVVNNTDGGDTTIARLHSALRTALQNGVPYEAVEGPNEPDLFWKSTSFKKSYKGQGWQQGDSGVISGTVAFMKDLYARLKSDPVTKDIPVIGPAFARVEVDSGLLTDYVDYGNFHPYPGGGNAWSFPQPYDSVAKYFWQTNQPSVNLDPWPYAFEHRARAFKPKPMMATETGYSTQAGGPSLTVHAKYIPRLFAEYFRLGVRRTYLYELVDEWNQPDNSEANYGLLKNDVTAKPAFKALQSMIQVLDDTDTVFTPSGIDYTLTVSVPQGYTGYTRTEYVHRLLLQKKSGVFYLLLWHEISNNDISITPFREIQPPPMPATLKFTTPVSGLTAYTYDAQWRFTQRVLPLSSGTATIDVPDRVTILKIVTTSTASQSYPMRGNSQSLLQSTPRGSGFDLRGRVINPGHLNRGARNWANSRSSITRFCRYTYWK